MSTPVIHRPSSGSKPRVLWKRIAGNRPVQYLNNVLEQITEPSNAESAQANIFVHSGEPGVRSPAMKRFI